MAETPIIVAGAGIGGLAAAVALARQGLRVRVIERAAEIVELGAGVQMGPNGHRALARLGLAEAMEAVAFEPRGVAMRDSATGATLVSQAFGAAFRARFGHPYRVAYRADLQRLLLDAARGISGVELTLGREVAGFAQDDEGVSVRLADGETLRAPALVGADGLWSRVRQEVLGDGAPRFSGHVAYRAMVPVARVPPEVLTDDVQVWIGPRHHLVCYKLRRGALFNIVAIFHADAPVEGWERSGDVAALHAGFAGAGAQVRALLGQVTQPRMWTLYDREPTPGWSQGRVTLLGDAAHPMLPYLAQGACMAIEDAVALADALAGAAIPAALAQYEARRLARTASVQLTARASGALYHADGPARQARDAAFARQQPDDYEGNAWLFDGEAAREVDDRRAGLFASR